eukprot:COSAG01_NODE_11498_length_1921_cov_4.789243_2_plen_309_part_00
MVLRGIEGHPFPDTSQDAGASFWSGALDGRRVTGRVLLLPEWEVTPAHSAAAANLGSAHGIVAALLSDGPIVLGLVAVIFVFRWLVLTLLLAPAGRRLVPPGPTTAARSKTLSRFHSAGWEAIFYTLSSACGLFVLARESFEWSVWPTSNIWVGWPLQTFDGVFQAYYLLGLAFYFQALLSLLLLDDPRSDFLEYLLHHLVTIFLIAVSYHTRIVRYGLVILLLHDIGDVFLNWAKVFKYCGSACDVLCTICFVSFVIVFFLTRLVFLPLVVIPSGYWEAMQVIFTSNIHITYIFIISTAETYIQCHV